MTKIEDLKKELKEKVNYDCDITLICDYEHGYIQDIINEIGDSQVDCYTSDLLDWANDSEHIDYIDNAMGEFGTPNNFIDIISQGQAYYYNELYNNNIEELCNYYYLVKLEEIGISELWENGDYSSIDFSNFVTLEEIEIQAREDCNQYKKEELLENINDYNFIDYTQAIKEFINHNKENKELLQDFYKDICCILETNKHDMTTTLKFYLDSDIFTICKEDFITLLEYVIEEQKEDLEIEEHEKELNKEFEKITCQN